MNCDKQLKITVTLAIAVGSTGGMDMQICRHALQIFGVTIRSSHAWSIELQ